MKNQPINNPLGLLVRLLIRYNFVILIVIASIGLCASVLVLNDILNRPYTTTSNNQAASTIFDQSTTNRITDLRGSSTNTTYTTLLPGRINPFSE